MKSEELTSQVLELLEPVVSGQEAVVDQVEFLPGNPATLRVSLDRAEGIGSLASDQVASLARAVSKALDAADPIESAYTLEVSTRGAESPLTTLRHYQRNLGRTLRVKTEGGSVVVGALLEVDDLGFTLEIEQPTRFLFADVRSARALAQIPQED